MVAINYDDACKGNRPYVTMTYSNCYSKSSEALIRYCTWELFLRNLMAEKKNLRENCFAIEDEFPDDAAYRDSEDEIFYPTSNEVSREDIEPSRSIAASDSIYRNLYTATRDALSHNQQNEYIELLHQALDKQDEEIRKLDSQLKELREECREYFTNLEEKLTCFEEKVDLVLNLVSSLVTHPAVDRKCRGFCSKHVRTEKCLCRGLRDPHRCCGRLSGLCEC